MSYLLVPSGVRVCAINFSGRIYLRCSFQLDVSINCTMTDCLVYDSCIVYVACLHLLTASSKDVSENCLGSNWQKRLCHQFLGVFFTIRMCLCHLCWVTHPPLYRWQRPSKLGVGLSHLLWKECRWFAKPNVHMFFYTKIAKTFQIPTCQSIFFWQTFSYLKLTVYSAKLAILKGNTIPPWLQPSPPQWLPPRSSRTNEWRTRHLAVSVSTASVVY